MEWTQDIPTKPGFYWLRDAETTEGRVVEIRDWGGGWGFWVCETSDEYGCPPDQLVAARWIGPLEPPQVTP